MSDHGEPRSKLGFQHLKAYFGQCGLYKEHPRDLHTLHFFSWTFLQMMGITLQICFSFAERDTDQIDNTSETGFVIKVTDELCTCYKRGD